ncbi:MAG: DUF4397 domain-containing protein [Caldilineaceae bacterium]|nr:DUF4397 domain-containing protein [Caldilineaceae bacterium]
MQSERMDEHMRKPSAWRLRRRYLLFVLLFVVVTVAYVRQESAEVVAFDTIPGGTIPPGGTLPPPVIDPAQGQVRVLHLAPIDADLGNTAVDICTEGGTPVSGLTGLRYGDQSSYVAFAPGTQDWVVGPPGCGTTLLDLPPFLLERGSALTLIIAGDGANQPLRSVVLVDAAGQFYRLYLPSLFR